MRASDGFGVNLMQPVLLGEGFADVVVHPVDGTAGVRVFTHLPVLVVQIVRKHIDGRADQRVGFARAPAFFTVEDICLGCLRMPVLLSKLFPQRPERLPPRAHRILIFQGKIVHYLRRQVFRNVVIVSRLRPARP